MFETDKVVGSYVDVFDVEHDEYELAYRYTCHYFGYINEGDEDDEWNSADYDNWNGVYDFYSTYKNSFYKDSSTKIYITDNKYGYTFINDEWQS